jgi:hypothetical protein
MSTDPLALERAYYLPPRNSGLAQDWKNLSKSQEVFADLCQRGHTMIANQIIEGRKNGKMRTIEELYQMAAKVRRAIAILNQYGTDNFTLYGHPIVHNKQGVCDIIEEKPGTRYAEHFQSAENELLKIATLIEQGKFQEKFGSHYTAKVEKDNYETKITIFDNQLKAQVVSLKLIQEGDNKKIYILHAIVEDQPKFSAKANAHLHKGYDAYKDPKLFWKEMANIHLNLFHPFKTRLGSQSCNLMVEAGIAKAMGYEVIPRKPRMDHFIDAEFTPYKETIEHYADGFIRPPFRAELPNQSFTVDTYFLSEAREKEKQDYFGEPLDRLTDYFRLRETDIRIVEMHVRNGFIGRLSVIPLSAQGTVERIIEFVGDEEIIDTLQLREGNFASPEARISRSPLSQGKQ